jgi:membrane protein implicated in regulation of membrane protease activity
VVFLGNLAAIQWATPRLGSAFAAQVLLCVPAAALSYLLLSRWVFRASRPPPSADLDPSAAPRR